MGRRKTTDVEKVKSEFLDEYARRRSVRSTCLALNVGRSTIYDWQAADPVFAGQIASIRQRDAPELEDELFNRGMGWDEVTTITRRNGDTEKTTVRRYSDKAAELWLRANDPVRYGNKVAVTDDRPKTETSKLLDAILDDPVRRDWLYEALDVNDDTAI